MNRLQRPITDRELRAWLAAGAVDRGVGEGLTFVASAAAAQAGKASWILRYRLNGRAKEKVLGRYIPLPTMAVEWLQKLKELACNAEYVLAARKLQSRMVPHVCESTVGVAMGKVRHSLPHFTMHAFRRTARTHLAALGVEPHVAERCLNHKLKGVEPARLL
jgi:integrase